MIVKCEQCQTKFKIPDEKVTEKGVKVRCTKCQHTFRVKRSGNDAVPADAPAAAEPTRPGAPPPKPGGEKSPWDEVTRRGVALTQGKDVPESVFSENTKVARVSPAVLQAESKTTPGSPVRRPSGISSSFDPSQPFAGLDAETTSRQGSGPAAAADPFALDAAEGPPAPPADPFGGFDAPGADPDPFAVESAPPTATRRASSPGSPQAPAPLAGLFEEAVPTAILPPGSGEPDRGMFDMPAPPPPAAEALGDDDAPPLPTDSQPLARIPLVPHSTVEKPSGRPEDVGMDSGPGRARQVTGLVVNVVIAGALVLGLATVGSVYLNEGKLDWSSISLDRVKGFFARSELAAVDVSNGLYDTRSGRPVFFVRGEVQNRGKRPARVRVHAEILDGNQVLQAADSPVGVTPSPEELYVLASPQDVTALTRRLDQGAALVAAGNRAPFLVTFFDYPPDLAGLRLKVTLREADGATAAVR